MPQGLAIATVDVSFPLLAPNGSAAAPSYSFASSTNTGFKCPAPGYVDLSVGGSVRYRWFDGQFYMGSGMTLGWSSNADAAVAVADLSLARLGAASLRLGLAPSATPIAQTFTIGEASRPGTDTDVGGANGTFRSGLGTGAGTPSKIVLITPTAVASGSTVQTYDSCVVALGGITDSFPALRRSGTALEVILAGTGAYTRLTAAEFYAPNFIFVNGTTTAGVQLGQTVPLSWISTGGAGSGNSDLFLFCLGPASLRQGASPSATPIAQTFTIGEASRAGTDLNVAGANGSIRSGLGTGNAAGSSLLFLTPDPIASSTVAQTYGQRLSLSALGATFDIPDQGLRINNQVNGAGASAGTLTNAPSAGNPNFWLPLNVNGTVFMFPGW